MQIKKWYIKIYLNDIYYMIKKFIYNVIKVYNDDLLFMINKMTNILLLIIYILELKK